MQYEKEIETISNVANKLGVLYMTLDFAENQLRSRMDDNATQVESVDASIAKLSASWAKIAQLAKKGQLQFTSNPLDIFVEECKYQQGMIGLAFAIHAAVRAGGYKTGMSDEAFEQLKQELTDLKVPHAINEASVEVIHSLRSISKQR